MTIPIFPKLKVKYTSNKKIDWNNHVKRSGSNKIRILSGYLEPKCEIHATLIAVTDEEALHLQGFFMKLRGNAMPFLWYDHEDNTADKTTIGVGDGVTREFTLQRDIGGYSKIVKNVIPNTLQLFVNDEQREFKEKDGLVTFIQAPEEGAKIQASFNYYWLVRLVKGSLDIKHKFTNINEITLTMEVVQ